MSAPMPKVLQVLNIDERFDLENELASLETVLELENDDSWSFEAVERRVAVIRALLKDGAR